MTSLNARALIDDPAGCGLLRSLLRSVRRAPRPAWDAVDATRPALTDTAAITRAVAAIGADTGSRREVYDRLVQSFVVDLDLLAPVFDQACGARPRAAAELAGT